MCIFVCVCGFTHHVWRPDPPVNHVTLAFDIIITPFRNYGEEEVSQGVLCFVFPEIPSLSCTSLFDPEGYKTGATCVGKQDQISNWILVASNLITKAFLFNDFTYGRVIHYFLCILIMYEKLNGKTFNVLLKIKVN